MNEIPRRRARFAVHDEGFEPGTPGTVDSIDVREYPAESDDESTGYERAQIVPVRYRAIHAGGMRLMGLGIRRGLLGIPSIPGLHG